MMIADMDKISEDGDLKKEELTSPQRGDNGDNGAKNSIVAGMNSTAGGPGGVPVMNSSNTTGTSNNIMTGNNSNNNAVTGGVVAQNGEEEKFNLS